MKEFIIDNKSEGQRFDKYLLRILNNANSSFIYKMLRKKNITLNDMKAEGKEILKPGDSIKIWFSDETFLKFSNPGDIITEIKNNKKNEVTSNKLNIVYEDNNVMIINKPVGILSQKADKDDISLNELIIDYLLSTKQITEDDLLIYKPSTVNRLDRNTSGLIVAAKNLKAAQILSEGFKERTIEKYYQCLVHGDVFEGKRIEGYLTKDTKTNKVFISDNKSEDSSYILTEYHPVKRQDNMSFLEVHLITGKTHQIRAHLASEGFPLCGDKKYGVKDRFKYQCLNCSKVVFPHYDEILEEISEKTFYGHMEKPWTSWINP